MSKKHIVSNISATQRVVVEVVEVKNEKRLEIRKEWRKTSEADWSVSKGITIPFNDVNRVIEALLLIKGD